MSPKICIRAFSLGKPELPSAKQKPQSWGYLVQNGRTKQQDVVQLVSVAVHTLPPTSQNIQGSFKSLGFSSDPKLPIPYLGQHQAAWGGTRLEEDYSV